MPTYAEINKNYSKAQRHFDSANKLYAKKMAAIHQKAKDEPETCSLEQQQGAIDAQERFITRSKAAYDLVRDETILFAINHKNSEEALDLLRLMFEQGGKPAKALSNGAMPVDLATAPAIIDYLTDVARVNVSIAALNATGSELFERFDEATKLENQRTTNKAATQQEIENRVNQCAETLERTALTITS